MNCLDVQEKMIDLIIDELPEYEKALILEHIEHCPECAQDFELMCCCIDACKCSTLAPMSETYWEEFVVSVHEKIALEKPRPVFPYRVVVPAVISAISILGIGYVLFFRPAPRQTAENNPPAWQEDPYQEVYDLTPEEQKEFIRVINQRVDGD